MKVATQLVTLRSEVSWQRIREFHLTFPWIDNSTKIFAGLRSSTNTLGKQNLPFCIRIGEDSLAGAMGSHEVDTDAYNPLLISLFAQARLGLINDMQQCGCYIGDLEVVSFQGDQQPKDRLVDVRPLSDPDSGQNRERGYIGRHAGIIDQLLRGGTGMHLIQSTWQAIERETENDNRLVVIAY